MSVQQPYNIDFIMGIEIIFKMFYIHICIDSKLHVRAANSNNRYIMYWYRKYILIL